MSDITIHFDDFVREHKNLLDVLKNPTKAKLAKEYKEQSKELKEKTGGLKGVSPASGFIQRAMAEMKKDGYKKKGKMPLNFDPKKVKKPSAFLESHIANDVPWEQRRAVPILSTGQRARVREIDGKLVDFNRTDPKYNRETLMLYPLPRAKARQLSESEKKAQEEYREAYTAFLKKKNPSAFKESSNPPPMDSTKTIQKKKGRPSKKIQQKVLKKAEWEYAPPGGFTFSFD